MLTFSSNHYSGLNHFTDQSIYSTILRYFTVTSSLALTKSYPCESLVTSLIVCDLRQNLELTHTQHSVTTNTKTTSIHLYRYTIS